jgi:hypothetical protein
MTTISRSVYQRLAEENKRLKRTIRVLCCGKVEDALKLRLKLRREFEEEAKLEEWIRQEAIAYGKAHPELIVKLKNNEDEKFKNFENECSQSEHPITLDRKDKVR